MYYSLNPGDKIGLVSPSRSVKPTEIVHGVNYLKSLGFEVVFGEHVFDKFRYMAGTAENRAADIMRFYQDEEIKAVFASSGGDGSQFIPPLLDWNIIKKNPKPFIGFSDTTALQNAIIAKTGQVCFTGLTLNYDFRSGCLDKQVDASIKTLLFGEKFCFKGGKKVIGGSAEGELIGGCLSLFRNLCGTEFMPNMSGKILLIEDVEEPLYKLDLMLQQISQNPGFPKVSGIVFGGFPGCTIRNKDDGTVDEMIKHFCSDLSVPVIKDYPYSHDFTRYALPLGAKVRLDADKKFLASV